MVVLADVVAAIVHKMGMKLNTDDAFNQRTNIGGIGFLLCTSDAFCLSASCKMDGGWKLPIQWAEGNPRGSCLCVEGRNPTAGDWNWHCHFGQDPKGGITTMVSCQLCKEHLLSFWEVSGCKNCSYI